MSLMSEFLGFAYFTELPAVLFDVQRVGPSTGMPTRTQQADILSAALRFARRHEARAAVPARSARVLRARRHGVRSRRPAANARDRDVGSRHRHERLDVPGARVGSRVPARSRQGAVGGAAREREDVSPLSRRRRRRHPAAHAARRASARRVFRARLGAQPIRRLHRGLGGVPASRRSPRQEMANGGEARAGARRFAARAKARRSGASSRSAAATRRSRRRSIGSRRRASMLDYCRIRAFPFGKKVRAVPRAARARVRRRAEPRRAAEDPAARSRPASRRRACSRSCTTAGCRWIAAASPTRSSSTRPKESRHDVDRETEDRAPRAQAQRARAHGARLRRRNVDAVRRLRSRLDHGRDRASVLRARHPAARCREDERHRLLVEDAGVFHERVARLQLRARPHAVDRDGRERREPRRSICSACPATATRCRSGSASSCTRCAAISTWCTSSRTTACTASPRGNSPRRPTLARRRSAARSTSSRRSTPCRWRWRSAARSSRAASRATRISSCR